MKQMWPLVRDIAVLLVVYAIFFVSPVREIIESVPRFQRGVIFLSLAIIIAGVVIFWRDFIIRRSWHRTLKEARKIANWYEDHVQKKPKKKKGVK